MRWTLTAVGRELEVVPLLVFGLLEGLPLCVFEVFAATVDFGRRRLGLAAGASGLALAGFSLGREVKKAPRTPSSSCGKSGTEPRTKEHTKRRAKRTTINLIDNSPSVERPILIGW